MVIPQHVFRNSRGESEQMSVGVAQNAIGDRLGSYDFVVNRVPAKLQTATLERNQGGYGWGSASEVAYRMQGSELELAIPWSALGLAARPAGIDFKWADNFQQTGDARDFTLNGDVAPNDRFRYRAHLGGIGEQPRP